MATSKFRTVVRNSGNMNKGGSKIISRYKDGSLVSTKTVRGSPNNKSGGSDNQYSTQVYTIDKPSSSTSSRNFSSSTRNTTSSASDSGNSELGATLVLGALGIIAAAIAAVGYGIYKFVCWCIGKFTHNRKPDTIVPTRKLRL